MMQHSKINGFTLLETIVVIAILAIVGVMLTTMIVQFYVSNNYVLQESSATQNAQNGLLLSLKYMREASYGDDGSYPIANAGTSTVTFYADTNNSGSVQKIQLYLSGQTLYSLVTYSTGSPPTYAGQPASTSTVATYVVNDKTLPIFEYYSSSGTLLSQPVNTAQIASVSTTLKIDVDPNRSPLPYTLTGTATLRNLRNH